MDGTGLPISWTPLRLLSQRFAANADALAGRMPELAGVLRDLSPSREYFLNVSGGAVRLGVKTEGQIAPLPPVVSPQGAQDILKKLYPGAAFNQPLLIVGEDLGWLWNGAYQLPIAAGIAPGYRSPLFLLLRDFERLWVLLHVHDWRQFLADTRVLVYVGDDAFERFRKSMTDDAMCPWPRLSIRVDPTLWPKGVTHDNLLQQADIDTKARFLRLTDQNRKSDGNRYESFASLIQSGKPLRILGITSRYTTFLQYSMRDWLAAFQRLGHQTGLLIEPADHEMVNKLAIAQKCRDFQPDLVLMIDHYRSELGGIPEHIPAVMWAQDFMPNIYRPEAGAAQNPRDFVLGFAYEKVKLVCEMGYPAERFMVTPIGMDASRFTPRQGEDTELARYVCDVSFVTHASTGADQLVKEQIDRNGTPEVRRLLTTIFERLRAIYEAGNTLVAPPAIRRMIDQSFIDSRTEPTPLLIEQLMDLFYLRVNNALFRHQALNWLCDLGIDLRLYGRGWESNPKFKRFARGVANHEGELSLIYQASRINLHASPLGSLHQRVMEGLASGGFFLLRRGDGDIIGRHYARLWEFCQRTGITTDEQLRSCTDPEIQETLRQTVEIHQCDPFAEKYTFMQLLQMMQDSDYLCSAGCVWGEDYDKTSFGSKTELTEKVAYFLGNPSERQRISQSMRQPVLDRFTYEKTSSRLLAMIAETEAKFANPLAA